MIPYIQAAKALAFILIVGGLATALEWDGYRRADTKWQIINDQFILNSSKKSKELTEKSIALEQQIEIINRSHEDEINQLHDDNLKLLNSGVRKRKVCTSGMPKDRSAGGATEGTIHEAELSDEFKEFLISDSFRADQVGLYAETAYQWVQELCKQNNMVCTDLTAHQSMDDAKK